MKLSKRVRVGQIWRYHVPPRGEDSVWLVCGLFVVNNKTFVRLIDASTNQLCRDYELAKFDELTSYTSKVHRWTLVSEPLEPLSTDPKG